MMDRQLRDLALAMLCFGGPFSARAADPASVPAPTFRVGDTWVVSRTEARGEAGFNQRTFVNRVERVSNDTMVLGSKIDGATTDFVDHLVGSDFSLMRVINGQETVTSKPFNFPLVLGKTWTVEFTDPRLTGPVQSTHVHAIFKVVGWEDVLTPAGKFRALKIEDNGSIVAQIGATTRSIGGGQTNGSGAAAAAQTVRIPPHIERITEYQEIFYAPEVRHLVKQIYEPYNGANVRMGRDTETLASFTPGA